MNPEKFASRNWVWTEEHLREHYNNWMRNGSMTVFPTSTSSRDSGRHCEGSKVFTYKILCLCRKPWIPYSWYGNITARKNWIMCQKCGNWFRRTCIGVRDKRDDYTVKTR